MATVAAVYTVAPLVRSPEEFLQSLMPRPPGAKTRVVRPRPVAKRVWASLEREPWEVVAEATLEAERQDPEQVNRWGRARRWGRDAARPRRNERRRLRRGHPPPGDWLSWRRTRKSHGYSPLDQITHDNVGPLQLAWVLSIREGNHQTTPLVHDGVMFLASPGNVVQAIDALTGEVLWQYRSPLPEDAPQRSATRTLALYGDKVYQATHDAALVALDARTGAEVWRAVKADYTQGFLPSDRTPARSSPTASS